MAPEGLRYESNYVSATETEVLIKFIIKWTQAQILTASSISKYIVTKKTIKFVS